MPKEKSTSEPKLQEVSLLLRSVGLKVTQARRAIISFLLKRHGPFTIDEIFRGVSESTLNSKCDVVTVYRCLEKFEKAGLVTRCDFGDGMSRFEIQKSNGHHHHIICRLCKKIEVLSGCPIDEAALKIPKKGFRFVDHRLEFFGICPDCYRKDSSVNL